jgi:hypothetical protein
LQTPQRHQFLLLEQGKAVLGLHVLDNREAREPDRKEDLLQ